MKTKLLTLLLAAGIGASPAAAQMIQARDPGSIVSALTQAEFPATLDTDGAGDPIITSKHDGSTFKILFYNCTDHKNCATVQFHSGYDLDAAIPLDKINAWNKSQRFGRAYVDEEGDPIIQMDLDLDDGGISKALFADNLEYWTSVLDQFEEHIGYDE
ncbi:YbjN domain-containing protein [Sphingosinicella sp. BN140058]|uniref:YbjN domain-containing protein n=1 Tax=Sphingosinicella sp. BN140058 TaxID=1892855 RepID=UPI001012AEDD|nr:YbjN domain-containing protein [Sphingosinicella sp. BN140058]QAY79001.1 YbjN domain-containing protein [Sphingosinicella sp. BN140058]